MDGDLGRHDDLLLVDGRLRVIALHPASRRLHVVRVKIGCVDHPGGLLRRHVWLRRASEAATVLHAPLRAVVLISVVCLSLDEQLLAHATL